MIDSHPHRAATCVLLMILLGGFYSAAAQPAKAKPMTNDDVIALAGAGISDDVIIAKIEQTKSKGFDLSTDGIIRLKQSGVSQQVIAVMLGKEPAAATAPVAPIRGAAPSGASPFGDSHARGDGQVDGNTMMFEARDVTKRVKSIEGEFHQAGFAGIGTQFMVYPGAKASVRTRDTRPTMTFAHETTPQQYVFLIKIDSDAQDNDRSVKIGSFWKGRGGFSTKDAAKPDPDWTLPYIAKENPEGVWHITPANDLPAGEYGLYYKGGLWAFGVDY